MSNLWEDRPQRDSLSSVWAAKIAKAPADVLDTVEVLIAAFDDVHTFGPCRWQSPSTDQTFGYTATTPDNWHVVGDTGEPAFQNSWVNYGSGWGVARFRKNSIGMVIMEGLVKSGTGTIFTLPTGFRPSADLIFPTDAGSVHGRFEVMATGAVNHGAGPNSNVSLSSGIFYVGPDLSIDIDFSYEAALPQVGDSCIVGFDEQNRPYVIEWWPA